MKRRVFDTLYSLGVIIAFLGLSGIAESFTGHGSGTASAIFFTAGLVMCMFGYIK